MINTPARCVQVAVVGTGMAGQAHAFGYQNASMSDTLAGTRFELALVIDTNREGAREATAR